MPRKPRVRSRHVPSGTGATSSSGASGSTPRRAGPAPRREPPVFWQCQSCGAPVESQFGVGDDSWCPSCHATGTVMGMEGQYPSPSMYGAWVVQHERQKQRKQTETKLTELRGRSTPIAKEEAMKRTKTHTGTFHCPNCFTEVELVAEESLKCDACKGPLALGSLDEIWAEEEED